MSRYIDADALIDDLIHNRSFYPALVASAIKNIPTADVVEVRHGEWGFNGMGLTCSECGEYALLSKTKMQVVSNFCPNCGADMRGINNAKE